MNAKFGLRSLFILTAVIALLAFGAAAIKQQLDGIDQAYWHEAFADGQVTKEEARAAVGDIVDAWDEPASR